VAAYNRYMMIRAGVVAAVAAMWVLLVGAAEGGVKVTAPSSLRQGDTGVLVVTGVPDVKLMEGSVGDRPLIFFPHADGYAALIGVDLAAPLGSATWRVGWVDIAGNPRKAAGTIRIKSRRFPVQRLSLPGNLVDLDRATEQRADREAAQLNTLYGMASGERLWRGHFTRPVSSTGPGEGFGARRVINGKPRSPHSGLDYSAPTGTPVVAANRGRVALIGDFFFGGRTVALDHGQGLYTLYMHLDRVQVVEGVLVERGETIGAVGSTGRATGPHLHWAAHLRRARVDPVGLVALQVRD
jgi:murein DD-endopeptidase MepM/ murein hydrolase activator NlpD